MGQFLLLRAFLAGLLRASWDVLEASGAVLGISWASWSDLSASRGPLGPSERPRGFLLARVGALLGEQVGGARGQAGAREGVGAMERPTTDFVFGHIFCLEGRKRRDLVTKMKASWARCVGGALIIASQGAKGPETHLPLQARWRMMKL